jgi:two-component system sensor histidine kinase QseC
VALDDSVRGQSLAIDRTLFELAVRNLLENALQLSPSNAVVRTFVVREGQEARVCVEDEGPGIADDELDLVQQRFYRGRCKTASGSGLGLAIVNAALERAGGALRLCRPETGYGLRAEIVVPADRLRALVA